MIRRSLGLALATALIVAPYAAAQSVAVAQLSGIVADDSGGALPGAEVTVTQTNTGFTRFVITGANGGYVFTNLPVGPYKIGAKLSAFSSFEQTGIMLAVGESRSVNITLKLGAMSETVSVKADATLVETRNLTVGTVVDQQQIASLPLAGRQPTQLLLLSGAVDNDQNGGPGNGGTFVSTRQYPNAVAISVAGGTGNSTMYLVDGGYNNDPQLNTGNVMPFPDALQEFRTESGVRDARYGMSTGATVNAVTKSGTNAFHGNAFEFGRHYSLNAIRYFDRKENGGVGRDDGLKRFQTGGTFGGPIARDKLFFFGGVQITNTRIRPVANDQFVPTAAVRAGDFRKIMSSVCRNRTTNLTLGAPFVDNQVNPALYNPISLKIMSMLPLPDPALDPDGCGRIVVANPNNSDEQQFIGRADYQVTPQQRVFLRYFHTHFLHPALFNKGNPSLLDAGGTGAGNEAWMKTLASGLDYVITPNLFSATRVSLQRTGTFRVQNDGVPTWETLGVKTWIYTQGPGNYLGGGTAGWTGTGQTGFFYATTPSISQDFDWMKGAHSLSFGAVWTRPHSNSDGRFQANGSFGFTGIFTSGTNNANGGLNMADFVLGLPATYRGGGSQLNNQQISAVGLYVGDVWRASRRLTLNYGLRWEPFLAAKDLYGFTTAFSWDNFNKGIKSAVYPNAPAGMLFDGDPGFPTGGAQTFNKLSQFAPRAGVVWDPSGNNEQTIRIGIGHYYDSPKLWQYAHQMLNPPFGNTVDAVAPASCPGQPNKNGCPIVFDDPWKFTPGGDPQANLAHQGQPVVLPSKSATFPVNGVYTSMPPHVDPMQVTQWNMSYQRQFLTTMLFDVTYLGNRSRNIWLGYEENPAIYVPGNCVAGQFGLTAAGPCSSTVAANLSARRLLTQINPTEGAFYALEGVDQAFTQGKGSYHGVKFSVNKRMSGGYSLNANYTYSKCVNDGEPSTDIGNIFPVPLTDPINNPKPDVSTNHGPCSGDRPHLFNVSSVVQSAGIGTGFLKVLTEDWQVGLIYQARSGLPLTPTTTGNTSLTGITVQRPNIVPGVDPNLSESDRVWIPNAAGANTARQWFNMAAFAQNGPGEWGNVPKGYLRGPSFWNVDIAFSRIVDLAAGRRLELRVEAFNLFDHVNWGNPNVQLGNANQGRVTTTLGDPRIMQLAMKYGF